MTNYLDKEGLKKFWEITKGKYSAQGHNHDDRYLKIGATAADSNKLGGWNISQIVEGQTIRNFTKGTLVKTSIDYVLQKPFLLEVKGNGYAEGVVNFMVQGYIWQNTLESPLRIVNPYAINFAPNSVDKVSICNVNGKLCFWWARQGYWQGYNITCKNVLDSVKNTVVSVTDSAKPEGASTDVTPINVISSKGGTLDGNLGIGTSADTTYKLKVNGSVQCVGNLLVNSNTECQGNLTVKNIFHSVGAATLDSALSVGGAATLNSSLTVKGATTVQGLTANGNITAMNGCYLSAFNSGNSHYAKYTSNGIEFTTKLGDTAKTLTFPSKGGTIALAEDVLATSGGTVNGVLMVGGAVTMQTTLKVTGNVGIGTDADAAYKLKVQGKAYFGDDTTVNGILTVNDVIRNGNFSTDSDGWVYTPHIVINKYDGLVINDNTGAEYTFDVDKAKELGLLS